MLKDGAITETSNPSESQPDIVQDGGKVGEWDAHMVEQIKQAVDAGVIDVTGDGATLPELLKIPKPGDVVPLEDVPSVQSIIAANVGDALAKQVDGAIMGMKAVVDDLMEDDAIHLITKHVGNDVHIPYMIEEDDLENGIEEDLHINDHVTFKKVYSQDINVKVKGGSPIKPFKVNATLNEPMPFKHPLGLKQTRHLIGGPSDGATVTGHSVPTYQTHHNNLPNVISEPVMMKPVEEFITINNYELETLHWAGSEYSFYRWDGWSQALAQKIFLLRTTGITVAFCTHHGGWV